MDRSKFSVILILMVLFGVVSIAYAQAPYSIIIEPDYALVSPGDTLTCHVGVSADPGFDDPIDFELQITVLSFQENYTLGTTYGPYPITEEFNVTIPEDVPSGMVATGLIIATSGEYRVEKEVTLETRGEGIVEKILNYVNDVIEDLIEYLRSFF